MDAANIQEHLEALIDTKANGVLQSIKLLLIDYANNIEDITEQNQILTNLVNTLSQQVNSLNIDDVSALVNSFQSDLNIITTNVDSLTLIVDGLTDLPNRVVSLELLSTRIDSLE